MLNEEISRTLKDNQLSTLTERKENLIHLTIDRQILRLADSQQSQVQNIVQCFQKLLKDVLELQEQPKLTQQSENNQINMSDNKFQMQESDQIETCKLIQPKITLQYLIMRCEDAILRYQNLNFMTQINQWKYSITLINWINNYTRILLQIKTAVLRNIQLFTNQLHILHTHLSVELEQKIAQHLILNNILKLHGNYSSYYRLLFLSILPDHSEIQKYQIIIEDIQRTQMAVQSRINGLRNSATNIRKNIQTMLQKCRRWKVLSNRLTFLMDSIKSFQKLRTVQEKKT